MSKTPVFTGILNEDLPTLFLHNQKKSTFSSMCEKVLLFGSLGKLFVFLTQLGNPL